MASHSWSESKEDISLKIGRAEADREGKFLQGVCLDSAGNAKYIFFWKKVWAFTAKGETFQLGDRDMSNIPTSHQYQRWLELRLSASQVVPQ